MRSPSFSSTQISVFLAKLFNLYPGKGEGGIFIPKDRVAQTKRCIVSASGRPSQNRVSKNWEQVSWSADVLVTIAISCKKHICFNHPKWTSHVWRHCEIFTHYFPPTSLMRALLGLFRVPRKCKLMAASLSTGAKASAKVYLQVLGTETRDTTPSLFLFADSQRCVDI